MKFKQKNVMLTASEERELLVAARSGDMRARERLILAFQPLAARYAFAWHVPQNLREDALQEGVLAIVQAVDRFDISLPVRFCTYAVWLIRHNIQELLRTMSRIYSLPSTSKAHTSALVVKKVYKEMCVRHGESHAIENAFSEAAKRTRIPEDKLREYYYQRNAGCVSFDQPVGDSDLVLGDLIESDEMNPQQICEHLDEVRSNRKFLGKLLDGLDKRTRDIVVSRFYTDSDTTLPLEALGDRYSISKQRVGQLQDRGLAKMRIDASQMPRCPYLPETRQAKIACINAMQPHLAKVELDIV